MKSVQSSRFVMYLAVKRELQAIVTTVGIAGHSALLDVLNARLEEIRDLHEIQTQDTAPKTTTRNNALADMILAALVVAGPLRSYAHQHRLHDVEAVADMTAYSFNRLRFVERPMVAQKIYHVALPLRAALAPLGVTDLMLDDLQTRIGAAKAILNEPRTTIISKHRATESLATLFPAIDDLLKMQIDPAMAPLRLTHPDLHRRYFEARKQPRRPIDAAEEPEAAAPTAPSVAAAALPPPTQAAA